MTPLEFTLFLIAWGLAGASPGPATLAIASTSMNRGRAAGLAVAAGIVAGSATWGIGAALGMSAVMLANAWAVEILRYVGAAYLMFLGFKALKSAMSDKPHHPCPRQIRLAQDRLRQRHDAPHHQPQSDLFLGRGFCHCGAARINTPRHRLHIRSSFRGLQRRVLRLRPPLFNCGYGAWLSAHAPLV